MHGATPSESSSPTRTSGLPTFRDWVLVAAALFPVTVTVFDAGRVVLGYPPTAKEVRPFFVALFCFGVCYGFGFHVTGRKLFASLLDFILAAAFLIAWLAPARFGETRLDDFFWLVPVEFVAISCAAGVLALLRMKTLRDKLQVGAVVLFLVLSSIAISRGVGHWWPFIAVALLGANQALSSVWHRSRDGSAERGYPRWLFRWFMFLVLYGILRIWEMPAYGWIHLRLPVLEEQLAGFPFAVAPYAVVGFGFLYFLWSGLYELTGSRDGPMRQVPHRPTGMETG